MASFLVKIFSNGKVLVLDYHSGGPMINPNKEGWENHLPKSMNWLKKVRFDKANNLQKNAWHVLFGEFKGGKFCLDESSVNIFDEGLMDKLSTSGLLSTKGPSQLWLEDWGIVLIPIRPENVSVAALSRQAGLDVAAQMKSISIDTLWMIPHGKLTTPDIIEGILVGYDDSGPFKSTPATIEKFPSTIGICGEPPSLSKLKQTVALTQGLVLTRWLQNCPSNWLDPDRFAEVAKGLLKGQGVTCQSFGREELEKIGMGAYLSVAAGSSRSPQLVIIEIEGEEKDQSPHVFIGKGVTFDAGGINVKPSLGLEEMKFDMSGGAAVLGAALYFQDVKPKRTSIFMIGAVENMPSGTATRPGDIVTSLSGKTVEINNTDAEGRLVLADLLTYAQTHYKPSLIADIATLTGAVIQGLGHVGAAFLTENDDLAAYLEKTGNNIGEPVWRMPLWPELKKEMDTPNADIKNIPATNVKAGTIMGAIFLSRFIEENKVPWVHIDIAGTAWSCAATGYLPSGGSSFGVRTLCHLGDWGTQ